MPMHRRNKCKNGRRSEFTSMWHGYTGDAAVWWVANRRRQRRRDQLSRAMRQQQRRIAKGKRR